MRYAEFTRIWNGFTLRAIPSRGMNQELSANTTLAHYRIVAKLGAGGMGEVWLAEDSRLKRKVALKVLPESIARDRDRLRRFEQEAFAASALNHPNILTIHEFGVEGETHFLSTEFIDGETLRARLQRGPLSLNEALDIAVQTAQALVAAHQANIIHRDIKPENVMLRKDGILKVLDFGLAKLVEPARLDPEAETRKPALTQAGTVMGTVAYMSPEQARGKTVDARTDIFGLGVMLYEMLTRRQPFTGETVNHIIVAILEHEPPPLASDAPAELTRIVSQALAKKVEERYSSAQAMLADLKKLQMRLLMESEYKRESADNESDEVQTLMSQQTTAAAPEALATAAGSAQPTASNKPKAQKWWMAAGLSLLVVVSGYFAYHSFTPNSQLIESIAVLPFENASGNTELEYLSDGVSESVIDRLSQLPQLKVIARSSSFRYRGPNLDLKQIADSLGVHALVTGRVVKRGDGYVIRVDVTDVRENKQLWGENFTRKAADVQVLQTDIAREIAENLRLRLSGTQAQQLANQGTANPQAYELLLKGRSYFARSGRENRDKAIEHYQQAVSLDPKYALAYAELAEVYGSNRQHEAKRLAAASKALELDPNLAQAHFALAQIKFDNWEWEDAGRGYRRAIELNPNLPQSHIRYSAYLLLMKRYDEAVAEAKRTRELDPLTLVVKWSVADFLYAARRYDEAGEEFRKTLELNPDSAHGHYRLGDFYMAKGRYSEAIAAYRESVSLSGGRYEISLANALARSGEHAKAEEILRRVDLKTVDWYGLPVLYASLNKRDEAFALLEKAFSERYPNLPYVSADPMYDSLRSDPRFQDLLRRIRLPQ